MENLDNLIVENIRLAMGKVGISQAELSLMSGIGKSKMSNFMNGRAELTALELFRISRIFGVTTDWFTKEHATEIQLQAA